MISGLPWGLALSSGVNTYLPLFIVALFARYGHIIHLSPKFSWLTSDQAIVILGTLAVCEILAQKFPVLDNVWDFFHTLLRPIAGAMATGATINATNPSEILVAMVLGATLAAAAHSTKSGLRLVSTAKTFGATNFAMSVGEDAGVLTTILLSLYAPWVMLIVVALFVVVFGLLAPRIWRSLVFELSIVASAIGGLFRWIAGGRLPLDIKESLHSVDADRLGEFRQMLDRNEDIAGALQGWKRSLGGPRRTWVVLTSRRIYWFESRMFGGSKTQSFSYGEIAMARHRNLRLFSRVEVLTHQHESCTLTVANGNIHFAKMAVQMISQRAGADVQPPPASTPAVPQLTPLAS